MAVNGVGDMSFTSKAPTNDIFGNFQRLANLGAREIIDPSISAIHRSSDQGLQSGNTMIIPAGNSGKVDVSGA